MKKVLLTLLAMSLLALTAQANTGFENITEGIVEGINPTPIINSEMANLPVTAAYAPVLALTIPDASDGLKVTITWDGTYYYALGSANPADIRQYDAAGNLLNTALLDYYYRGFFYNSNDGQFYIKHLGTSDLMTVDPLSGVTTFYMSSVVHSGHGNLAYDASTDLMYEMASGTVYAINLTTGVTVGTYAGISGTNWAVATNGSHFFTWDGTSTVYAYNLDGTLAETFTVPNGGGSGNWYLSHCNNMLWTGDGSYGVGNWYGFNGVEGGCGSDVAMTNLGPDPVPACGSISVVGTIGNPCADPITTDVWYGVIYLGTFYEQGKVLGIPLAAGQYVSANLVQNIPCFAPPGVYDYCAYSGTYDTIIEDTYCFSFTISAARGSGGADDWSVENAWDFGVETPKQVALVNNYPNPFNATTAIAYELPTAGHVNLEVYNLMGQKMETLINGNMEAGQHSVTWDAASYSSGIYFYKLQIGEEVITKRMTLLK